MGFAGAPPILRSIMSSLARAGGTILCEGKQPAADPWPSHGAEPMPRTPQDYDDIPGTFVFDAERSRQGYGINMFCMSLMKEENRKAFKADEAEYLKRFRLTPDRKSTRLNSSHLGISYAVFCLK